MGFSPRSAGSAQQSSDVNSISLSFIPALGMIAVGAAAVVYWRKISGLGSAWLWLGAGLWTVAVALKFASALALNQKVIGLLAAKHSAPLLLAGGAVFLGIESAFFEVGLTFAAVLIWRPLGRDAPRAIGIGVGAGAFEALLLGLAVLTAGVIALRGTASGLETAEEIQKAAAATPLFWLALPFERAIAILGHAASRALVLLGTAHRRPTMICWGWLLFALVDGIAGAFQLTGKVGRISMWWIELAVLPFALLSIPILRWCWRRWPQNQDCIHATQGQAPT